MRDPVVGQRQLHYLWPACPNCSQDLSTDPIGSKPPHTYCPFCGVPLSHVWWQRTLVTAIALVLAYGVPASLGIRGIMPLLFVGLLLYFPALVLAMVLIFKVIRPKYVRKVGAITTLFQRQSYSKSRFVALPVNCLWRSDCIPEDLTAALEGAAPASCEIWLSGEVTATEQAWREPGAHFPNRLTARGYGSGCCGVSLGIHLYRERFNQAPGTNIVRFRNGNRYTPFGRGR
jgi:hypothetical protein